MFLKDLIRISTEVPSLEDFDARESVGSWFSQGQRSRGPNYRSWPSEGHVEKKLGAPVQKVSLDFYSTFPKRFQFVFQFSCTGYSLHLKVEKVLKLFLAQKTGIL